MFLPLCLPSSPDILNSFIFLSFNLFIDEKYPMFWKYSGYRTNGKLWLSQIRKKIFSLLSGPATHRKTLSSSHWVTSKGPLTAAMTVWEGRVTVPVPLTAGPRVTGFWRTTRVSGLHRLDLDSKRWSRRRCLSSEYFSPTFRDWNLRRIKYIWARRESLLELNISPKESLLWEHKPQKG